MVTPEPAAAVGWEFVREDLGAGTVSAHQYLCGRVLTTNLNELRAYLAGDEGTWEAALSEYGVIAELDPVLPATPDAPTLPEPHPGYPAPDVPDPEPEITDVPGDTDFEPASPQPEIQPGYTPTPEIPEISPQDSPEIPEVPQDTPLLPVNVSRESYALRKAATVRLEALDSETCH